MSQYTFGSPLKQQPQEKKRIQAMYNAKNSCMQSKILASHVLQELLNNQMQASNISKASSKQNLLNKRDHSKLTYLYSHYKNEDRNSGTIGEDKNCKKNLTMKAYSNAKQNQIQSQSQSQNENKKQRQNSKLKPKQNLRSSMSMNINLSSIKTNDANANNIHITTHNASNEAMPTYSNFAKLMEDKNQKIGMQDIKIRQLENFVRSLKVELQSCGKQKQQYENDREEKGKLKEQLCELREIQLHLQTKIQVLEKQKEHLVKKANSYLTENEELTIKITSLKEEYLSKIPQQKMVGSLKNELAFLKLQNLQLKQEGQDKVCLEEKVNSLEKTVNQYMFKYDQAQSENSNWQIKYYKLQKQFDISKLEIHQLQATNKNICKVMAEQQKLHNEQLQKWKARITKMEQNSITDRLKTENQFYQAMATFNELEERCNKLQIESVLEQKILEKDKQIILFKKKEKQNQLKFLQFQKLLKEQNQKVLNKLLQIQLLENTLRKQKQMNQQNTHKINELNLQNKKNMQKIQQSLTTINNKENYIKVLQQKCKQMIQQNQRITKITENQRRNAQVEQQNLKCKISELNALINCYHKNNENLFEQMKGKQQKIEQIKNQSQISKQQYLLSYKNLQVKCKELMIRQQQYGSIIEKAKNALLEKQMQFTELKKVIELKDNQIGKLNKNLSCKQKEIKEFNNQISSYLQQKKQTSIKLQQSQNKIISLQATLFQSQEHFKKVVRETKNNLQQQKQQNKQLVTQINSLHKVCNQQISKIDMVTNCNVTLNKQIESLRHQICNINSQLTSKTKQNTVIQKQTHELKQVSATLQKQIKVLKQQKINYQTTTKNSTAQLINENKQLNIKISESNKKLSQLNAQITQKQALALKNEENLKKQMQKHASLHKDSIKRCQQQWQIKCQQAEQKIFELQKTAETIKRSQQQLFAKYDEILKINLQKDKAIHQLQQNIKKAEIVEKDVKYMKKQIESEKQNNKRLKQFNGKLNEQYEQISEKYIKCYKDLQEQQVTIAQLKEYIKQLEQKITMQQSKVGKLVNKIGEVEQFTLRQNRQQTMRNQQVYLQQKEELEASIRFLSEELGIWSHKYEIINKQNSLLKTQLEKYRTLAHSQSSKTVAQSLSNSIIISKLSKNKQIGAKSMKQLEREAQKYKVEAQILRQQNAVIQKTMNAELQKRKQIIEQLIKQKNILYSQITTNSLSNSHSK